MVLKFLLQIFETGGHEANHEGAVFELSFRQGRNLKVVDQSLSIIPNILSF